MIQYKNGYDEIHRSRLNKELELNLLPLPAAAFDGAASEEVIVG